MTVTAVHSRDCEGVGVDHNVASPENQSQFSQMNLTQVIFQSAFKFLQQKNF